MPTSPLKGLVEPEVQKAQAGSVIAVASPLLIEVLHYGSNVWARCQASHAEKDLRPPGDTSDIRDEHFAIGMLYRHLLELLDGMEPLVRECATVPSQLVVRGIFEALLQLEWMLQDDTLRRAHLYLAAHMRKRLRRLRGFDPATQEGQDARDAIKGDGLDISLPVLPKLEDEIKRRASVLQKPLFLEADQELQRSRAKRWFQGYGGPRDYRQLAARLGRAAEYWLLYGGWSATAHGEDAVRHASSGPSGPSVTALRDPSELHTITSLAVMFALGATRGLLAFYRPWDLPGFSAWYQANVKQGYRGLATLQVQRV